MWKHKCIVLNNYEKYKYCQQIYTKLPSRPFSLKISACLDLFVCFCLLALLPSCVRVPYRYFVTSQILCVHEFWKLSDSLWHDKP